MLSEQGFNYTMLALVIISAAYCFWPRPSFVKIWSRSKAQLLAQAAGFSFIKHADQLSEMLWMLETIADLGDEAIKQALGGNSGKLDNHTWQQLLSRPEKLKILLDKIATQGFTGVRELELTELVKTTSMYWTRIKKQDRQIQYHNRMREIGAEQRASWQCGLRDFAVQVEHSYESKALALVFCRRSFSSLTAFKGRAAQCFDINSLIQIEGCLYRVTQVFCLTFHNKPNELVFELYCFATGSTHYLSAPDSLDPGKIYFSTYLGCNLAEFDDPPGEISLGEIKAVISPEGPLVERGYILASHEKVRILSVKLKSEGWLARWSSDELRVSALWLHGRRVSWQDYRLPNDRSTIRLVVGD